MPVLKHVNQKFFKNWSPEMAYLLGYIAADGSITIGTRKNSFLDLQSIDEQLINLVKKLLSSDHKISTKQRKDGVRYRLQIGNKNIVSDLSALGLGPRKSARLQIPKVPEEYFFHFLRGYFDGDGNISVSNKYLLLRFTTSSQKFLQELRQAVNAFLNIKGSLFYNANAWRLNYSGKAAMKLLKAIYSGGESCCLKRKYVLFLEANKIYGPVV